VLKADENRSGLSAGEENSELWTESTADITTKKFQLHSMVDFHADTNGKVKWCAAGRPNNVTPSPELERRRRGSF